MRKKIREQIKTDSIVLLLLVLAASPALAGISLDIRISGAQGFYKFDEINTAIGGWRSLLERQAGAALNWTFDGGTLKKLRNGFDFESELLFNLTRRWSLGVSVGYTFSELSDSDTTQTITKSDVPTPYTRPTKASGVPVVISAYHNVPLGKKFDIYGRIGAGWIWAKYTDRDGIWDTKDQRIEYSFYQSASGRGILYQGGLGIRFHQDQTFGFFIEGDYRKAQVDSLSGKTLEGSSKSISGDLYAYEIYNKKYDYWQPEMEIKTEAPAGDTIRSVRKAVVDFSGFVLRLGVIIKF